MIFSSFHQDPLFWHLWRRRMMNSGYWNKARRADVPFRWKKNPNILGRILNVPFKILETMNTLRCNAKLWIKIMQNRARHIKMVNNSKSPSLGWLITKHYLAFLSGYKYLVLMSGYLLYTTNSFITFVRRWETPKNSIQLNQVNEHTHTYIYMCLCVYIHIKLVDEPLTDED